LGAVSPVVAAAAETPVEPNPPTPRTLFTHVTPEIKHLNSGDDNKSSDVIAYVSSRSLTTLTSAIAMRSKINCAIRSPALTMCIISLRVNIHLIHTTTPNDRIR
jgi:hypothetical protein